MKETSSQEEAARWRGPAVPCERRFRAYLRAGDELRARHGDRAGREGEKREGKGAQPPLPSTDGPGWEK